MCSRHRSSLNGVEKGQCTQLNTAGIYFSERNKYVQTQIILLKNTGRGIINTMILKCNMLNLLVARPCNSASRMWRGLHALRIPADTETGIRGVDPREGPLTSSDTCMSTCCCRVQVPDHSLTLGLIHSLYLEPGLLHPTRVLSPGPPWCCSLVWRAVSFEGLSFCSVFQGLPSSFALT